MSLYKWNTDFHDKAIKVLGKKFWRHPYRCKAKARLLRHERFNELLNVTQQYQAGIQIILNEGITHVKYYDGVQYWFIPVPSGSVVEDYKHVGFGESGNAGGFSDFYYPYSQRTIVLS